MRERVGRMSPERNRRVRHGVRHLAVELRVVDLARGRIVERIGGLAEAAALRERLFLVHLGPQDRVRARALGLNRGDELLHRAFQLRGVEHERNEPERVLTLLGIDRHVLDQRMPLEALDERLAEFLAHRKIPLVEALELAEADRGLDLGHAEVVADAAVHVELLALHDEEVELRLDVVAVVTDGTDLPREVLVVADDHAAFAAGREVLGLAEREAADRTDGAGLLALVHAAEALRAVLDHEEVVLLRDLHDRIHVGDHAVEVDDDDGLRLLGDRGLDLLGIEEVVRPDVDEDGERTGLDGAEGGGDERIGGADDLVTRADAERGERAVERRGAVGDGDRVLHAEPLGPLLLELHADGAGPVVDLAGMEDVENDLVGLLVELRPGGESLVPDLLAAVDGELGRLIGDLLLRSLLGAALLAACHGIYSCVLCCFHAVPRRITPVLPDAEGW